VLDTNVVIGFYLSRRPLSANAQVFKLWRDQRKLQLILSVEMETEYFEVLSRLSVSKPQIRRLAERFKKRYTITFVNLGARTAASRDSDDNLVLATAMVGKARFLITNDRDLLDISAAEKKRFKFAIVTPAEFLSVLPE
jgi:putative toxin-antitoxin system toxin component, PIN family